MRSGMNGQPEFYESAIEQSNSQIALVPHKVASPTKIISTEDALGAPCNSFSFDDDFKLDSELDINDYSPMSKGAPFSIDNRVSPLQLKRHAQNVQNQSSSTGLFSNIFPVKFENEDSPSNGDIVLPLRGGVSALHESAVGHTGKFITLKLRVQYLKNAQKYLMNQKDMLMALRNH